MVVLFSPSEQKHPGATLAPMDAGAFAFANLYPKRMEPVERYREFVKNAPDAALSKLTGIKDTTKLAPYREDIAKQHTATALELYNGVAYEYLDYPSLDAEARRYCRENTLIFSNLFGPVMGGDRLPLYKIKQGESIDGFKTERFYKQEFSEALDGHVAANQPVIDLRAGFYEKFYTLKVPFVTFRFLKGGRALSHWAKAYRGVVLRALATAQIKTLQELKELEIEGLSIVEIWEQGLKRELVCEV